MYRSLNSFLNIFTINEPEFLPCYNAGISPRNGIRKMAKREKRYQLPKNLIVLPLILYTFVFLMFLGMKDLSLDLFSIYTTNLKLKDEIELTTKYKDMYDSSTDTSIGELSAQFEMPDKSSLYTVFVANADGENFKVKYPENGKTSAILKIIEPDENGGKYLFLPSFSDTGEIQTKKVDFIYSIEDDVFFFADKSSSDHIRIDDDKITPNIAALDLNFYNKLVKEKVVYFDYWIAYQVKGGSEVIGFKASFPMTISDFAYHFFYKVVANVLVTFVFILLVSNVIRTHKNNRRIRKVIFRDNITVDRNWFWFAMKSKEILRKRRKGTQYAIVSLIFVRYRNYVLCHSVDQGEQTLRLVYQTICAFLDKKEICSHGTINNFQLLLKAESEEQLKARLEKIIKSLEAIGGDHDFKFQAGVHMIDPKVRKNADIDLLYNNASAARTTLEYTEESGIAFFGDKLVEDEKWIDTVTERQRDAVEKEEFKVYYQPKYDPRTNEQMGAEALIRWNSKDMGFVSPSKFIPIFEKSGFITEIDDYMLTHVARDQKKWLDENRKCVPVSVNVSRAHFSETNLAEHIRDIVDREGTPHELIEIELTESAFFDDQKLMLTTIKKFKEYGFLVSMDDFGSGYSSLNSLKDMPLDILKLDAGFFRGEKDNKRTEIVVSEALHLAKKLNMTTVAEGVEDKYQVDFLAAEGCSMIQGFYYAEPMPKEEYEAVMGLPAKTPAINSAPAQPEEQKEDKEMNEPEIKARLINENDAQAVSDLIRKTISISNKKDYPEDIMDQLIAIETPEHVLERASWTHFYVFELSGRIIACGAIGPYWGKEDESSLFTIFVSPEYQGKGVGRFVIDTLEKDEFFTRAKRIEIPASITGVPFYLKMGYNYKGGITEPDEEHLIRLEKFKD